MNSKQSRVVLITGAGSGIGSATAERLAEDGERVVINDLSLDAAEEVSEGIRNSWG